MEDSAAFLIDCFNVDGVPNIYSSPADSSLQKRLQIWCSRTTIPEAETTIEINRKQLRYITILGFVFVLSMFVTLQLYSQTRLMKIHCSYARLSIQLKVNLSFKGLKLRLTLKKSIDYEEIGFSLSNKDKALCYSFGFYFKVKKRKCCKGQKGYFFACSNLRQANNSKVRTDLKYTHEK